MRMRVCAVVIAGVVGLCGVTPSAADAQYPGHQFTRKDQLAAAKWLVGLDYRKFQKLKYRHPRQYDVFDWSSDGCDSPAPDQQLFRPVCELHDFGYRNLGGHGLALSRRAATRRWIDDRQREEMKRLCDVTFSAWYEFNLKVECRNEAKIIWLGVRTFGADAFYFG